jgi:hypothetical protein
MYEVESDSILFLRNRFTEDLSLVNLLTASPEVTSPFKSTLKEIEAHLKACNIALAVYEDKKREEISFGKLLYFYSAE